MLSRIGKLLKNLRSRKGYTLIEAATVVAITGAMALVSVPIASDKIEDSKIATASGSTIAIATAMVKFFGDTGYFPIASGIENSLRRGSIARTIGADAVSGARLKVMRSGLGKNGTPESDNTLDPDLDSTSGNLTLWDTANSNTAKANAGTDGAGHTAPFHNLNDHIVADTVGYAQLGNLNWFGPYIPAIDQDPWGRNYLVYAKALDPESLAPVGSGNAANILVPKNGNDRIYAWVISAGPDEKLQTDPTTSIIKGDDIGTLLAIPPVLIGQNDAKQK